MCVHALSDCVLHLNGVEWVRATSLPWHALLGDTTAGNDISLEMMHIPDVVLKLQPTFRGFKYN